MRFFGNLVDWRQVHPIFILGQISLHTHKFQDSLMVIDKVIFIDKLINKGCDWWLNGVVSWHETELQFADGESFVVTGVSFADLELSEWPLHRCCHCEGYCHEKLNPHHFYQLLYIATYDKSSSVDYWLLFHLRSLSLVKLPEIVYWPVFSFAA